LPSGIQNTQDKHEEGVVPWRVGFSEYNDTYKSCQRKKKIEADRWKRLEQRIADNEPAKGISSGARSCV
jgi:hypothetical protein